MACIPVRRNAIKRKTGRNVLTIILHEAFKVAIKNYRTWLHRPNVFKVQDVVGERPVLCRFIELQTSTNVVVDTEMFV